jgi:hypothetical protein
MIWFIAAVSAIRGYGSAAYCLKRYDLQIHELKVLLVELAQYS